MRRMFPPIRSARSPLKVLNLHAWPDLIVRPFSFCHMALREDGIWAIVVQPGDLARQASAPSVRIAMANTPRRPTNPMAAAEAAFKPVKRPAAPIREASVAPNVRELVSLRIDRAVLDHFQEDGPGWQDRINDTLRQAIDKKPIAGESERTDD
jgi:uncharacterized protein (DUF4415 family)